MLEIVNGETPVLVSVTIRGELVVPTVWAGKLRLAGARLTAEPRIEVTPVPLRLITWNAPQALSAIVTCAENAPVVGAENDTLMVQVAPGARPAGGLNAFPGTRHAQNVDAGESIPPETGRPVVGSMSKPVKALKSPVRSAALGT